MGLALLAGYVDAYGLIWYQTYLSFMSGNTTQTGSQIGQWHLWLAWPSLLAIVSFVAGVFTGTLIFHDRPDWATSATFALVALLILVVFVMNTAGMRNMAGDIVVLALAMGILNTTISRVGSQSVNIGFVTGTLNGMANHLALAVRRSPLAGAAGPWDTHATRAWGLLLIWCAFFGGALLAGYATPRLGVSALAFPLVVLAVWTVVEVRSLLRNRPRS